MKKTSPELMERLLKCNDKSVGFAAGNACMGMDLPIDIIDRWLHDRNWTVQMAAVNICRTKDVPIKTIELWMKDTNAIVRFAAMIACHGKSIPIKLIRQGLNDDSWMVCTAAMNICQWEEVPTDILMIGIIHPTRAVNMAAAKACLIKKIPFNVIEEWLTGSHGHVYRQQNAMEVYRQNKIEIPVVRTLDPPDKVYGLCLNDVIVVAEIPPRAQVRGKLGAICRASEAIIVDIIGSTCGEKAGIPIHDNSDIYQIGDHIVIDNFDYSDEECSTGYHFFCTMEEAKNYK